MYKVILLAGLLISSPAFSQQQESQPTMESIDPVIFTSIEPADGRPAVFPTQEELDAKIADKIDKIKQLIYENRDNAVLVEGFRKDLWRFENAIVQPTSTKL